MANDVLEDEIGSDSLGEVNEALRTTVVLDSNELVTLEEAGSLAVDERTEELIDGTTSPTVDEMIEKLVKLDVSDPLVAVEASEELAALYEADSLAVDKVVESLATLEEEAKSLAVDIAVDELAMLDDTSLLVVKEMAVLLSTLR